MASKENPVRGGPFCDGPSTSGSYHPSTSSASASASASGGPSSDCNPNPPCQGRRVRTNCSGDVNMPPFQSDLPPLAPRQKRCVDLRPKSRFVDPGYMLRPSMTEVFSDGSTRFSIQAYPLEALTAMNTFRREGQMCDVILEVQGEQIEAHKLVLAACSFYFRGMFTNGMIEQDSKLVRIHEPSITPETMRSLVEFAYTQCIHITQENVQSLLLSAIFLEMSHVIEACALYMEQQLDPSNCIGVSLYAKQIGCLDLEQVATKFIEDHFCDVITYDEVLNLDEREFLDLISKDQLNIRCETQVFRAVVRWVEHDPERRKRCMDKLLQKVRLSTLAPSFLVEQLQKCSLIQELPHCEQMLMNQVSHLTTHRTCLEKPRLTCKSQVIYSIGGFSRKTMESMSCFECYNPRTKEWNRLPDLPIARSLPGVASLKGVIYVLGGRLRKCGQDFDSCSVNLYDPIENKWSTRCPMNVPRNRVGVGILDDFVYAVGGRSGGDLFKSAERYDQEADCWTTIADMKTARMGAGIAVINRLLYAVGGVDDKNQRLSSVECYHPEKNEWHEVASLNQPRSGAGVAVLNDYIYAVGGFDGTHQLQSVERYDVSKKAWEEVTPLPQARSGIQMVASGDKLYTLGGYDGNDFLSSVQSYHPGTDSWQSETTMLCKRSGHGVAVSVIPSHL